MGATAGSLHLPNGAGKSFWPDGKLQAEGSWEDGLQEGAGCRNHKDGGSYKGNLVHGKPEGAGLYTWRNGSSYEGQ